MRKTYSISLRSMFLSTKNIDQSKEAILLKSMNFLKNKGKDFGRYME